MTREEMQQAVKSWGVKPFKIERSDSEAEVWNVRTRRHAVVVDGALYGAEILVDVPSKTFRVWTSQRKLAKAMAGEHGLRVQLLDGEAELYVPAALADEILPRFGAKHKREINAEQREALKLRLSKRSANTPV